VIVVGNQVVKRKPIEIPTESPIMAAGPAQPHSDMQKRQLRSSRSNRRSLSNSGMTMNSIGKIYQNGKKLKRTGSRSSNRSKEGLPPLSLKKQNSSSKMSVRNRTLTPQASRKERNIKINVVMTPED